MSDVSALVDKLKSSLAYKQFDAPRPSEAYAWPILEKMARTQAAPLAGVEDVAPANAAAPDAPLAVAPEPQAERSLFDRLQAQAPTLVGGGVRGRSESSSQGALFSRSVANGGAEESPRMLSDIFARIERKAR